MYEGRTRSGWISSSSLTLPPLPPPHTRNFPSFDIYIRTKCVPFAVCLYALALVNIALGVPTPSEGCVVYHHDFSQGYGSRKFDHGDEASFGSEKASSPTGQLTPREYSDHQYGEDMFGDNIEEFLHHKSGEGRYSVGRGYSWHLGRIAKNTATSTIMRNPQGMVTSTLPG